MRTDSWHFLPWQFLPIAAVLVTCVGGTLDLTDVKCLDKTCLAIRENGVQFPGRAFSHFHLSMSISAFTRCFAGKSVGQTTRSKLGYPEAAVSEWRLLNVAVR